MMYLLTEDEYRALVPSSEYAKVVRALSRANRRVHVRGQAVNEHSDSVNLWVRIYELETAAEDKALSDV